MPSDNKTAGQVIWPVGGLVRIEGVKMTPSSYRFSMGTERTLGDEADSDPPRGWRLEQSVREERQAMQDRTDPDALLTPSEVAEMFRVNPKTVTRWARAGKISAIRTLGGHRRFRAIEISKFLEQVESEQGL